MRRPNQKGIWQGSHAKCMLILHMHEAKCKETRRKEGKEVKEGGYGQVPMQNACMKPSAMKQEEKESKGGT